MSGTVLSIRCWNWPFLSETDLQLTLSSFCVGFVVSVVLPFWWLVKTSQVVHLWYCTSQSIWHTPSWYMFYPDTPLQGGHQKRSLLGLVWALAGSPTPHPTPPPSPHHALQDEKWPPPDISCSPHTSDKNLSKHPSTSWCPVPDI